MAAVTLWLTNEGSDISGYLRAKLGARSEVPSLVRAVTNSAAGGTLVQATLAAGGAALAWLTDPLDGTDLTAAAWELHAWARESDVAANAGLRLRVYRFAGGALGTLALDHSSVAELPLVVADSALVTAVATVTAMNDGDRLAFLLYFTGVGVMAAGSTLQLSYNGLSPYAEGDSYVICPDGLALTAAYPSTTIAQVRNNLIDTSGTNPRLTDAQVQQALDQAIKAYSEDAPRELVEAYSGDGTTQDFALPRSWVPGLSRLVRVESPAGQPSPTYLDENEDWIIYRSTLGRQPTQVLRFLLTAPDSGTDNVLVTYTTRHVHSDILDTIPPEDLVAVCWLAASYGAVALAGQSAKSSEPLISADSVNRRDDTARWHAVAKELRARYADFVRQKEGPVGPTVQVQDWDWNLAYGGDRLIHRRRWR